MDKLLAEKRDFDAYYMTTGTALVKETLDEFMHDHPEVNSLQFSVDKHAGFFVDLGKDYQRWESLVEINPKLSVCLNALETKFTAMLDVVQEVFGEDNVVTVTHTKTTTHRIIG